LLIASSTGGPSALMTVLGGLPRPLLVPVLVVQHMPPVFTRMLADRLASELERDVVEATDGLPVVPDRVYVAPGDRHMVVRATPAPMIQLVDSGPVNQVKPAADPLFASATRVWGGALVACVLTGMGHDGRDGCVQVRAAGGRVLVQDRATSAAWGMPGAVAQAGLADGVYPLDAIAGALTIALAGAVPAGAPRG
jgi:two-component system chemotaxis response regulator CheB